MIDDGHNGFLVSMFDPGEVAKRVVEGLRLPGSVSSLLRSRTRGRALSYKTTAGISAFEAVCLGNAEILSRTVVEKAYPHEAIFQQMNEHPRRPLDAIKNAFTHGVVA